MPNVISSAILRFYHHIKTYFTVALDRSATWNTRCGAALKGFASLFGLGIIALVLYAIILIPLTPSTADLRKAKNEQPSVLISADGKRLAVFNRLNREWVPLSRISPNVVNALIATEDHRFYEHHGVEPLRMLVGAMRTVIGDPEGGSTITQQLARNMYPEEIGRKRTITRKFKEIITALKLERAYTKKEILESYLNTVPFLYNAFGIEMAARTYFDKPASKLSLLESATLVGMLKGTSYYNPVFNPERAMKRRNVVLQQMVKRKVLSQANFDAIKGRPVVLDFERQQEALGPAPHFAQQLRKWLIEWADRNDYNIYQDGLMVYTTIDSRMQALANRAVNRQAEGLQAVADVEWASSSERLLSTSTSAYVERRSRVQRFAYFWNSRTDLVNAFIRESSAYKRALGDGTPPEEALATLRKNPDFIARLKEQKTRLEAGFIAVDPVTAHVKAWVGSRDFVTDQYDHVGQARRQPGSTFKPFVYGAALEQGMSPTKQFIDAPIEITLPNGAIWKPSDITAPSGRSLSAREGLMYSKNTITARVMLETGPARVAGLARKMGVNQSPLDPVPSLALGTSPVTLFEMATAYMAIADGGEYRKPVLVTRITDKAGNVLASFDTERHPAMSRDNAEQLVDMMRGAINQGTGQGIRSRFGIRADVAGKTGTTQDNSDGWFMLMHPRLVVGSWVGFNDSRVSMRSTHWGQGGHNALLVVGDFFQQALNARLVDPAAQFTRPSESIFDKAIDIFRNIFGADTKPSAPPSPSSSPSKEPEPDASPLDALEKLIKQARDVEKTYIEWRQRIDDFLNTIKRLFSETSNF
ncbi:penicillin-binding protein 1A [Noviherbaspirillum sp. Root189]|uniref:penicillin-binding protein 1A n=1 Tax=Noviherbaspirillum sp. Root189 TaxID=1736487 RepID=UPI00070CABA8|nr:transglycosylase domain-containing protein [Noviherbaspirillum sp. Root189]KRB64137.1 penicillin-binding protein [Noviherbaspirillum sp. Root189]